MPCDGRQVEKGSIEVGLFRRGTRESAADETVADELPEVAPAAEDGDEGGARERGPWDVSDVDGAGGRLDLGAILLPGRQGMELRMEIDKASGAVSAAAVSLAGSTLQVQAFAAPRTEGIWDEIREEIAESVTKQGGSADDLPGPFGRELLARLPVRTPEGRTGHRPARFIGADGPRWFLRGVVTGKAAVDPEAAAELESVFADIVVVRGTEARAPRDLLTLRLPSQVGGPAEPVPAQPEAPSFDPLTRGPEITEIR